MAGMPGVWEFLSYLRGDQANGNAADAKMCDMRDGPAASAEAASQRELDQLHSKVANQKQEILDLTNQVLTCRGREEQATARLAAQVADVTRLRNDLSEAHADLADRERQIQEGAQQMRHRQAQLEESQLELNQKNAELSRCTQQMQKLESAAAEARTQANQLSEQLTAQNKQLEWLETQLKTAKLAVASALAAPPPPPPAPVLDVAEMDALRAELASVRESLRVSEQERESEIRMIQEALDGALQERAQIEVRYRSEVEQLKTMTAEREAQLMEDAEARLRELQKSWKTKLDEKERAAEARALEIRKTVEAEMEAELAALSKQRADVEEKQGQVEKYKSYEAEVVALRGLTYELLQGVKTGTRQLEDIKEREASVSDENKRLNDLVKKQTSTIKCLQNDLQKTQDSSEAEMARTRSSIAQEWEEKLLEERRKLRHELDEQFAASTREAVEQERSRLLQQQEETKLQSEQDITTLREEIRVIREELERRETVEASAAEMKEHSTEGSDEEASSSGPSHSEREESKDSSPLVNGHAGGTDREKSEEDISEDKEDSGEGEDEDAAEEEEEEDWFDEEDSEAAGEEIRRRHKRDIEHLLRASQDQRRDMKLMLEAYEARTAQTQEELRRVHAERSKRNATNTNTQTVAGLSRPVPGSARLAAILTALQECGDQLVRLIAARDLQKMRSVRVLVPARMRKFSGLQAPH